jgi:hypothetical protein
MIVRRVILFILCLPFNLIVGWPAVLIARWCWGTPLTWEIAPTSGGLPALTTDLKADSWAGRTWGRAWAGVTLGHAIVYGPGVRVAGAPWAPVQAHEHVHVEQFEGTMAAHALLGLLQGTLSAALDFAWILGLVTWFLGYLVFLTGGWLGALLRGESAYRGSAHEEAARAESGS